MQVFEHAFAMLDFAAAEAPGVGPVEAGRVALEPGIFFTTEELFAQRKADDHAEDARCVV